MEPGVERKMTEKRTGAWAGSCGLVLMLALVAAAGGCASVATSYLDTAVDFSHIKKCAILPFGNLTSDSFADERIQSIFMMEVLKHGSLVLVDPEETAGAMRDLHIGGATNPTPEQIVALGKALSVEAVFQGTVEEYGQANQSRQQYYFVTGSFSMAETETGKVIWRSQVHVGGSSLRVKLFGGEPPSLYDVSRKAVRKALEGLF